MYRASTKVCACALLVLPLVSCGTTEPPPSTVIRVADASPKSKELAKIAVLSPSASFEADPREDITVKGAVTVADGEKGPETLRLRITKAKAANVEFGTFSLAPEQRDKSFEFEAKVRAPNVPGPYELRCVGTYQLQGPDGKVKITDLDSNIVKFQVRK